MKIRNFDSHQCASEPRNALVYAYNQHHVKEAHSVENTVLGLPVQPL